MSRIRLKSPVLIYSHLCRLSSLCTVPEPEKMPSSIIEEVTAEPIKAPARAKVNLIAWDPESPAHVERMFQQRVACGWNETYVEKWRGVQREGKMTLQWVVS